MAHVACAVHCYTPVQQLVEDQIQSLDSKSMAEELFTA